MTTAGYKYAIKSKSGYSSDQTGKITPERHGIVCAALDGLLVDDANILKAAPDLLEALIAVMEFWEPITGKSEERATELKAYAAIARAEGESQ